MLDNTQTFKVKVLSGIWRILSKGMCVFQLLKDTSSFSKGFAYSNYEIIVYSSFCLRIDLVF
jgi:hypothetical protein